MKSIVDMNAEVDQLDLRSRDRNRTPQVRGKAKKRIRFVKDCILLLESVMTHESAAAQLVNYQGQYDRAKATYYSECGKNKETGERVKNLLQKFHTDTGARKLWRQIQNLKFILSA